MRHVLKSALLRMNGGKWLEHPTADMLAAFSRNAVRTQERDCVLEHLARCQACRECIAIISDNVTHSRRRVLPWKTACGVAASLCALAVFLHFRPYHSAASTAPVPVLTAALKNAAAGHTAPEVREIAVVWRFRQTSATPVLQKSDDGGKSWKPVTLDRNFRIQSLAWNGVTAWARGEDGGILESRDAGSHWTPLSFSPHELFTDAAVRTGGSGTLTVITAAGGRWSRVNGVWRGSGPTH
ncbi:MAG: hypothetical protein M3Y57_19500 [Acidobacteriota bacterium]|nr:hypothetical protein [Acidobacteriota bacterium]